MSGLRDALRREFPFFCFFPAVMWQVFFLYVPLAAALVLSLTVDGALGSGWTLNHFAKVLNPVYLKVLLDSVMLATYTTILCLIVSYPVAYFLALKVRKYRGLLLVLLILPSWTNFIVQVYAWFFLLGKGGFLSSFFHFAGLSSYPILLNTYTSTLIGMVYCFLPFMIFPLYAILDKMDKRLIEASADLGANRFNTFWRVTFPLSLPGVYAGCLLVFVPAFGEFAIPLLLGGGKTMYFGNVISDTFLFSRDWASGFALALTGILLLCAIVVCLASLLYFTQVLHRRRVVRQRSLGLKTTRR